MLPLTGSAVCRCIRHALLSLLFSVVMLGIINVPVVHSNQSAPAGNAAEDGSSQKVTHILAFGDSLTAGYGLENMFSFPVVLERQLRERGHAVRVTNAGVSGDTSAGGAARISWALADKPDILILELGANDALQGLSPEHTKRNLADIIRACQAQGVRVLLAGMHAPRNLGPEYAAAFDAVYPALVQEFGVAFHPFFLEGVALDASLNQQDGMHPNAAGVEVVVRNIVPAVERLLP